MLVKKENGFTGIDIAISIIVTTIFIAVIGNLIVNINLNSKDIERKTVATAYAVQEIEQIKTQKIDEYVDKGIEEEYITIEKDIEQGYHEKVIVKDYVLIKQDNTKEKNLIKEVTVEISYKLANKEKKVSISTYIAKE